MGGKAKFILFLILLMVTLHLLGKNLKTLLDLASSTAFSSTPRPQGQPLSHQDQAFLKRLDISHSVGPHLFRVPLLANLTSSKLVLSSVPSGGLSYGVPQNIFTPQRYASPPPLKPALHKRFWRKWKEIWSAREEPSSLQEEPSSSKESFLQITLEDTLTPRHNPALSHRDNRILDDYLKRLRSDNMRLVQDAGELFGRPAREETIRTLTKTERVLEGKAKTTSSLSRFFAQEEKIAAQVQKDLNDIFNRYRKNYNKAKPAPYNGADWKEYFRQYNSWKRQGD